MKEEGVLGFWGIKALASVQDFLLLIRSLPPLLERKNAIKIKTGEILTAADEEENKND